MIAPARQAAFGALVAIARGRVDLDAALDRARESLSDTRDVALVRELVTGTLRWQARLDWQLAPLCRVAWRKIDLEVQTVLRWATANRIPVVPRGMGTGLSGGATAVDGGIVLS